MPGQRRPENQHAKGNTEEKPPAGVKSGENLSRGSRNNSRDSKGSNGSGCPDWWGDKHLKEKVNLTPKITKIEAPPVDPKHHIFKKIRPHEADEIVDYHEKNEQIEQINKWNKIREADSQKYHQITQIQHLLKHKDQPVYNGHQNLPQNAQNNYFEFQNANGSSYDFQSDSNTTSNGGMHPNYGNMEFSEIKCRQDGSPGRGLYNVESEANLIIAAPQNMPTGYHNTHHPGSHHDAPPNTENQRNFLFDISPNMDQLDQTPKIHTNGANGISNSGHRKITINKSSDTRLDLRREDSKRDIRSRPSSANQQVIKISTGTFNNNSGNGISNWDNGFGGNRAKSSGQARSNIGSKSNKSRGSNDDGRSNQLQKNVNNSPPQEFSRNENALQVLREQKKNEMSKYLNEHHKNLQSVENRINPDGQAQIDDAMNSIVMNHKSSNPNLLAQNNQYPPVMHQSNPNLNSTPPKCGNRQLSWKNSNSGFGSSQKPNFEEVKGKMACQKRDNSANRSSNGKSNNSSTYNSMKETAKPKRNMIPNQVFFNGSQQYNSQPQQQKQLQEQTMPKNHNQNMRANNQNHVHPAHTVKQPKAQPQAPQNPKNKFKNVQSKIRDQII